MNAEQLLAHFERITGAPNAIPRLRRFILDLAVRGKLVPQDPNDEPAPELLRRIVAEKARLVKAGEFREPRNPARTQRERLPFVPPPHWCWTRLIEIVQPSYGFAFNSDLFNSAKRGMPLIRIRDISKTDTEAYFEGNYDPFYLVQKGDYLVGMDGDFNVRRWEGRDGLLNQRVMRINSWRCGVVPEFVKLPLQFVLDHLHGATSLTTVKHLSAKQVNGIEIPLPPLAEQHRIVAKVDELMALCDRLETARVEREAKRDRMTTASLARLNAPDPDPAVFRNDAAFALNNLSPLTTRPDQIKAIRQTILNLAIRGKLVPQDPNDEPASELLKRIAKDFSRQVAEGKLNKPKPVKPLSTKEGLFSLPPGWAEARFNQVAAIQSNLVDPKRYAALPHIAPDNIESWTARLLSYVSVREAGVYSGKHLFSAGAILYSKIRPNLAKVAKVNFDGLCSADMYPLHTLIDRDFLVKFMITKDFVAQAVKEDNRVAMPKINQSALSDIVVLVPPLAEQHRIVAKVDELMTLCDQLEASLTTGNNTRRHLLDALLHEALVQNGKPSN